MENRIDYAPTYVEYAELIRCGIEDDISKLGLDDSGRKMLFKYGVLDASNRYDDILEDATEDKHTVNWMGWIVGINTFLDEIGVVGDGRAGFTQLVDGVGKSIFGIYNRMRQDIESKDIKMWAGPVSCFRVYLASNSAELPADFRQVLAIFFFGVLKDGDIVRKALDSEYLDKVNLQIGS